MLEMYNRWFHSEIEGRLGKIKDFTDRVNFLYDEKTKFISQNQGTDANQIAKMFDNLIEKEKLLNEVKSNSFQKNNISESQKLHKSLIDIANEILGYEINFVNPTFEQYNEIQILKDNFSSSLFRLIKMCQEDNFYWQYCPLTAYKSHFELRKYEYLTKYVDSDVNDFLDEELELIKSSMDCNFYFPYYRSGGEEASIKFNPNSKENSQTIKLICKRKTDFLLKEINSKVLVIDNEIDTPEIFLDYSQNSQTERIVFLKELGILGFLQRKITEDLHGFSANKLAEVVSTFTGIEQRTAQSYLNPIISKDAGQKNNPLTKNNLEKVRNKLKDIGFNNSKSA